MVAFLLIELFCLKSFSYWCPGEDLNRRNEWISFRVATVKVLSFLCLGKSFSFYWCPGEDLNLHALRRRLLRPLCLPFHHLGMPTKLARKKIADHRPQKRFLKSALRSVIYGLNSCSQLYSFPLINNLFREKQKCYCYMDEKECEKCHKWDGQHIEIIHIDGSTRICFSATKRIFYSEFTN